MPAESLVAVEISRQEIVRMYFRTSTTYLAPSEYINANHDFQNIVFNDGGNTDTFQLAGDLDMDYDLTITDARIYFSFFLFPFYCSA